MHVKIQYVSYVDLCGTLLAYSKRVRPVMARDEPLPKELRPSLTQTPGLVFDFFSNQKDGIPGQSTGASPRSVRGKLPAPYRASPQKQPSIICVLGKARASRFDDRITFFSYPFLFAFFTEKKTVFFTSSLGSVSIVILKRHSSLDVVGFPSWANAPRLERRSKT